MSDYKPCCIKDCNSRGVRFIASSEATEAKWYCYSHGDDILDKEK